MEREKNKWNFINLFVVQREREWIGVDTGNKQVAFIVPFPSPFCVRILRWLRFFLKFVSIEVSTPISWILSTETTL